MPNKLMGALGRRWGLGLRGLVLLAALIFLAQGVQWTDLTRAAQHAGFVVPALIIALNACMMAVNALRLRLLLRSSSVAYRSCFLALLTSSALNNITPFRGGDVARLWMLNRSGGVTKSTAAAVAVVENLVQVLVLAAICFAGSLAVPGQGWATIAAPVVFCAALAALLLLRLLAGRAAGATDADPRTVHGGAIGFRVRELLGRLEPGFRALSERGTTARALGLSVVSWTCEGVMVVLCAHAMGLTVGFALAPVVLFAINLALALPSTPAGAGPFESAAAAVLVLAGVAKGPAVAFALLYHAIQVIPVTLVGISVLLILKRARVHGAKAPGPSVCGAGSRA